MATYRYSLFLRNDYLGDGIGDVWEWKGGSAVHNHAYFCHTCGELWARAVAEEGRYWMCSHAPCDRCGIGRINLAFRVGEVERGPRKWAEREFLLSTQYGQDYWDWWQTSFIERQRADEIVAGKRGRGEVISDEVDTTPDDFTLVPEF